MTNIIDLNRKMYYAILLDDDVLSVMEVESFVKAVKNKNMLQARYNQLHGCDEVLYMRTATHAEYLRFVGEAGGFMAGEP
jgi:hypothetical protein